MSGVEAWMTLARRSAAWPVQRRSQRSRAISPGGPVTPDDYLFADDDGVAVVAQAELSRVIETAKDIAAREGAQAVRLLKGELLRSQFELDKYVAKRRSDPSFTFREHLKSFGGAIEI
jgi:hypothetical protein